MTIVQSSLGGLRGALAFLVLLLLASCSPVNPRVSVLWTNLPELATYAEAYNASQKDYQILVEYQDAPSEALLNKSQKPDLVVARGLSGRKVRSYFSSLNFLFERAAVTREQFYSDFLFLGMDGETQLLMPVSFNVPILLFKKQEGWESSQGLTIDLDDLRKSAAEFSLASDPSQRRLGFSPRWGADFLLSLTMLKGVGWGESFSSEIIWDEAKLTETLAYVKDWIEKDCLGTEKEGVFTQKYLMGNPFTLIQDERIWAYPYNLRDFLTRPEYMRTGLDFRYPTSKDVLPVSDDLVFAGIPSGAQSRSAAEGFLSWFFKEDTQKALLAQDKSDQIPGFGIAEGFSSLHRINEKVLPELNTLLIGRIPQPSYFQFPSALPPSWDKLKAQVLLPWLANRAAGKSQDPLTPILEKWYLQRAGN